MVQPRTKGAGQRRWIILGVGALIALLAVVAGAMLLLESSEHLRITSASGNTVTVEVEIADEPAEHQQGLMDREHLPEDTGMLFVFANESPRKFWMHNTTIPLDLAYINDEGEIIGIDALEPLNETSVHSSEPVRYALEVNRGFFAQHGIQEGDVLDVEPFR